MIIENTSLMQQDKYIFHLYVKYIFILLHQAGVFSYHCMMHGTTTMKDNTSSDSKEITRIIQF